MGFVDWTIILLYLGLTLGIALWAWLKRKNTPDDYFLADRNLGWWIVGASIFASNIGSEHLVGLAGSGATDGVAMAHYELHAWCLLILAWVFVPFYMRSRVYTMPEFLERRFSPANRLLLSVISLIGYVLTKMAVGIFAGGVVFGVLLPEFHLQVAGFDLNAFWVGSIVVVLLTGVYTVAGGMKAVAYTEAMQTLILILGSATLTFFGLRALGGWAEFRHALPSDMFNLWKPLVPHGMQGTWSPVIEPTRIAWYFNGNFPWIGMLFAAPIIGLWYWTTDQYIVQRALGAENETQARRGSIFAGMLKLLPVFIFIIPGMIAFALALSGKYAGLSQMVDASGKVIPGNAQSAFPLLVMTILPVGVRGIVVAGLLAALMSSLAGAFNASSTLFTMDVYSRWNPTASKAQLVWVGRVATGIMVLVALLWIPVIQGARGLYQYLQGVQSYLAPPIFTVFFLGVFNKRLNAKGALAALIVGFALGAFRLAVDTPVALGMGTFHYASGSFLWFVNNFYFQYYSLFIFLVSVAVMLGVSYATEAPSYERISGLTFGTVTATQKADTRRSWGKGEVIASAVVLLMILMAYLYFRG